MALLSDLEQRSEGRPPVIRSEILGLKALCSLELGRPDSVRELLERSVALAEECGNLRRKLSGYSNLGMLEWTMGRLEEAKRLVEQAEAMAEEAGEPRTAARMIVNRAGINRELGQVEETRRGYEQALKAYREIGEPKGELMALGGLAVLHAEQGKFAVAVARSEEAWPWRAGSENRWTEGQILHNMAGMIQESEGTGESERMLEEALRIHREVGDRPWEAARSRTSRRCVRTRGRWTRRASFCAGLWRSWRRLATRGCAGSPWVCWPISSACRPGIRKSPDR